MSDKTQTLAQSDSTHTSSSPLATSNKPPLISPPALAPPQSSADACNSHLASNSQGFQLTEDVDSPSHDVSVAAADSAVTEAVAAQLLTFSVQQTDASVSSVASPSPVKPTRDSSARLAPCSTHSVESEAEASALNSSHDSTVSTGSNLNNLAATSMSSWFANRLPRTSAQPLSPLATAALSPLPTDAIGAATSHADTPTDPVVTDQTASVAAAAPPVDAVKVDECVDAKMDVDKEEGELSSDDESKTVLPSADSSSHSNKLKTCSAIEQQNGAVPLDVLPLATTVVARGEVTSTGLVSPRTRIDTTEPILEQLGRAVKVDALLQSPVLVPPSVDSTSRARAKRSRSRSPSPVVTSSGTLPSTPDMSRTDHELETVTTPTLGTDTNGISPVATSQQPTAQPPSKKKVRRDGSCEMLCT